MRWMVLVVLLGGCFVEATAGIGKRTSEYGGGFCVSPCGITEEEKSPNVDVGIAAGFSFGTNGVSGAVGASTVKDPGRDEWDHQLDEITMRLDLDLARIRPDLALRLTSAYARIISREEGNDLFAGATLERTSTSFGDVGASLGIRRLDYVGHSAKADGPRYHEARVGAEIRVIYRFGTGIVQSLK